MVADGLRSAGGAGGDGAERAHGLKLLQLIMDYGGEVRERGKSGVDGADPPGPLLVSARRTPLSPAAVLQRYDRLPQVDEDQ